MVQAKKNSAVASKPEKGEGNRPVQSFNLKGVRVSVFANQVKVEGREAVMHKTVVTKTYKDDGGEFKSTTSLGRDDLPVAVMLMEDAYRWILEAEAASRKQGEE
jgi:hypothetical protein